MFWPKEEGFGVIRSFFGMVNFGLYLVGAAEASEQELAKKIISGVLGLLGLIFLFDSLLSSISSNSNSRELFNKKSGLLTNLLFFLLTELLPVPYLTLFLAPLSCNSLNPLKIGDMHTRIRRYKKKLNICLPESNLLDGSIQENGELKNFWNAYYYPAQTLIYIWVVYSLKQLNFNRSVSGKPFGAK